MNCCCSLAGTSACEHCLAYKQEIFPYYTTRTYSRDTLGEGGSHYMSKSDSVPCASCDHGPICQFREKMTNFVLQIHKISELESFMKVNPTCDYYKVRVVTARERGIS